MGLDVSGGKMTDQETGLGGADPKTTARGRSSGGREQSRAEFAYDELKRRIISLDLRPGQTISAVEVATTLGISRTPATDALSRLRMEGLVTMDEGRPRVAPVTLRDVRELFEFRACIEGEAVALAAVKSTDDIERLRALDELCSSSYDPEDPESVATFLSRNTAFHVSLASLSDNARLTSALRLLMEQLERVCHLTIAARRAVPEDLVHDHADLLGAVMAGDADEARRVAVAAVRESARQAREVLSATTVVTTANLGELKRYADG